MAPESTQLTAVHAVQIEHEAESLLDITMDIGSSVKGMFKATEESLKVRNFSNSSLSLLSAQPA